MGARDQTDASSSTDDEEQKPKELKLPTRKLYTLNPKLTLSLEADFTFEPPGF